MRTDDLLAGLPGELLVREGLADLRAGRCTIPSCVVSVCRMRLTRAGLIPAGTPPSPEEPEFRLYDLLGDQSGDVYSRYNALLREMASFNSALDHRLSKLATLGRPEP